MYGLDWAFHRQEKPYIGQVVTIFDVLPGNPDRQRRKLALLGEIRKLADDLAIELGDDSLKQRIRKERSPESLRVLVPADLPPLARRPFTETDGTIGRVVLAYHSQDHLPQLR